MRMTVVFLLFLLPACMLDVDSDDELVEQGGTLSCQAIPVEVIVQGRENRFGLAGQQVALDPGIPMERVCNRVVSACKQTCFEARASAQATGIKGFQDSDPVRLRQMGGLADDFNAALGLATNFKALGADPGTPEAVLGCNARQLQVVVKGKEHRFGFDGRQVALNPAIPIDNLCNQLSGSCRAICTAAKAAAVATGVKGFSGSPDPARLRQMGVLADDFNAAFGRRTDFANRPIFLP